MVRRCLLITVARISIGPYFIKTSQSGLVNPEVEHAGVSLELSGDEFTATLPIYRRTRDSDQVEFFDYLVCHRELNFNVSHRPFFRETPLLAEFVALDAVLATLYDEHQPATPLFALLKEFRDYLPVHPSLVQKRRKDGASLVSPEVRAAGFEVIDLFLYGRTLLIQFGWVFPQDRSNPTSSTCLYASAIECKPTPSRTLGKGKWLLPLPNSMRYLLARQLKKFYRKDPLKLLSEEGVAVALERVTWTKVFLLTPKEIRQERIEFVREHPELLGKPTEMAKAMIAAGLYTRYTELGSIKKQLLGLVAEGGVGR